MEKGGGRGRDGGGGVSRSDEWGFIQIVSEESKS